MNPFLELLFKPEFCRFAALPLRSMGLKNFGKSLYFTKNKLLGPPNLLPRYLFPALWRNLADRKAVVTENGVLTFAELSERVVCLSNSLNSRGIKPNDRIATLLNNEQSWFEVMLACMIYGIKMPMLNTHLKPSELIQCINDCAPKVLIFSESYLDVIREIQPQLKGIQLFVICSDKSQKYNDLNDYTTLNELIDSGSNKIEKGKFGLPQMPFSGGSTGVPKFIVEEGSKENQKYRQKGVSKRELAALKAKLLYGVSLVGAGQVRGQVVSLIPGPLYHTGVQVAVLPLYLGGTVVPMHKFDAENFLNLIASQRVNFTFVAPTMLERILKLPTDVQQNYDLSSMQVLVCAAAPCPDYVKKGINTLFRQQGAKKNVFHEYYGSSESSIITVLQPKDYEEKPERYKSVGKVAGCECMVYNTEEGRQCAIGEDGHVLIRASRMYSVDYGNSNDMEDSFIDVDGVYWFDDGCIGHFDEDGFLYLTSRSKDMIISGGVNIFPVEIEEVIKRHPKVLDAAVVKVADDDLGEVPGAVIQAVNSQEIEEQEIIGFCRDLGLYGYKLPKYLRYTENLPRNSAGKIRKKELESEF